MQPGDDIELRNGLRLPAAELTWRTSRSGGPGGQHANTSNTRVELLVDVERCTLPEWARARILAKCGDPVRVIAADERSLWQNRRTAMLRLQAKLNAALVPSTRRIDTRPTRGSVQRRLESKRIRAQRKVGRRRPIADE